MIDHVQMGLRMEQARKERGMTLKDVASAVGVAASTVQRYEKGNFSTIKMPVVESIAATLDVNPAWLTGHTDDPVNYATSTFMDDIPDTYRRAWLEEGLSETEMRRRYQEIQDETRAEAFKMCDADIRAAFFNGIAPDLSEADQKAIWDEARRFMAFRIADKQKGNK